MKRTPAFPPEVKQTTTLLPTIITTLIATTGYAKYNYYFCFWVFTQLRISRNIPHISNFLKMLEKDLKPKRRVSSLSKYAQMSQNEQA